jgi:hypothetical protein
MDSVFLRRVTLGLVLVGGLSAWQLHRARRGPAAPPAHPAAVVGEFLRLEAAENEFVRREWSAELDAEKAEDQVFQLWDALNREADPWLPLAELPLTQLHLPGQSTRTLGEAEIQFAHFTGPANQAWSGEVWRAWLDSLREAGWKLAHSHWRLPAHQPAQAGTAAHSQVEVTAHLSRADGLERVQLSARLRVRWASGDGAEYTPVEVWVEALDWARRVGPPPFRRWLEAEIPVPRHTVFTDPLLGADLEGDGFSELLLVGAGRVWRNRAEAGGRTWVAEPFPGLPPERIFAAALTATASTGRRELWLGTSAGLALAALNDEGRLVTPLRPAWLAPQPLKHPQVLAVGDVEGDGDLDVWLAQYKLPYQGGQFPTPWFDAQDGFASYLLLNDGHGQFSDGTAASGLAVKAQRRTYSASFLDYDGDGDLDLINVSDFAGVDIFRNDGRGHFTDVTESLGEARHAFGMAHAFNDPNGDARPELLLLGMDSPVAERLNALGLDRPLPGRGLAGFARRAAMVHGNRLLAFEGAGFRGVNDALAESLRHTGWTWGCAWSDFNNDGELDLAVANGHETLASVRDYERQFWRHDLFVAGSTNAPVADLFFRNAAGRRRAAQASYGGWQANEFRLSIGQGPPREVAWLLGVAETADCRNLVADDFDGDGRLDLAVTTFEQFPVARQRLLVWRNELPVPSRNWLGIQLTAADLGARVEVQTAGRKHVRWLVVGDSFRSQSPARLHFGLGAAVPTRVEVIRTDGRKSVLASPRANAWQEVP